MVFFDGESVGAANLDANAFIVCRGGAVGVKEYRLALADEQFDVVQSMLSCIREDAGIHLMDVLQICFKGQAVHHPVQVRSVLGLLFDPQGIFGISV